MNRRLNGADSERDTRHFEIELAGSKTQAETVTSLEDILLRRGYLGALTDTERVPSLWVNTALVGSYFLLPPVGGVLLIRRAVEVNNRMAQGWLSLPAEFQVSRLGAPAGRQQVWVRAGGKEQVFDVEIRAGRLTVLVVQTD